MPVAFDSVGPGASGATATGSPLSWTHTPAGAPGAVLVGAAVGFGTQGVDSVGACTYGGAAMTPLGFLYVFNGGFGGYIEIFGLASPAAGPQAVVYTPNTTSAILTLIGGSLAYAGTAATTAAAFGVPVLTTTPAFAGVGSVAVAGTAAANMVAGVFASGGGGQAITAGTLRYLNNLSSAPRAGNSMGADTPSAAGTVTISGSWTASFWGAIAVEIIAGGGSTGQFQAALNITPAMAATMQRTGVMGAALAIAPGFQAVMNKTGVMGAALAVAPQFRAVMLNTSQPAGRRAGPPDDGHRIGRRLRDWI